MHNTPVPSRSTQLYCSYFDCTFTSCSTVANSDLSNAVFDIEIKSLLLIKMSDVKIDNLTLMPTLATVCQFVFMLFNLDNLYIEVIMQVLPPM